MSKQEVIKQLEFIYGEQLPPKTWFIHDCGAVEKHEGLSFRCQSDRWWFLDDYGCSIYSGDDEDYPIHEDLLFETEEEAKRAAEKYCHEEIARLQRQLTILKGEPK